MIIGGTAPAGPGIPIVNFGPIIGANTADNHFEARFGTVLGAIYLGPDDDRLGRNRLARTPATNLDFSNAGGKNDGCLLARATFDPTLTNVPWAAAGPALPADLQAGAICTAREIVII